MADLDRLQSGRFPEQAGSFRGSELAAPAGRRPARRVGITRRSNTRSTTMRDFARHELIERNSAEQGKSVDRRDRRTTETNTQTGTLTQNAVATAVSNNTGDATANVTADAILAQVFG